MRRLTPAVLSVTALALGLSSLAVAPARAATVPSSPFGLAAFAALGGAGLTWSDTGEVVTGYRLYRDGQLVTDLPDGTVPLAAVDSAVPPAGSADYTVTAYGDGGESAPSPAVHVTRPASDPTPGSTDAMVADIGTGHLTVDSARTGDTVALDDAGRLAALSVTRLRGSSELPLVAGPGDYDLTTTPLALELGTACADQAGTLTVREAAFDTQLQPLTYAADAVGTCSGRPFRALVRWHSGVTYTSVTFTPSPDAVQAEPGTTKAAPVTVTNTGMQPLAVGTPAVSGAHASDWTADGAACAADVPAGGTCTLAIGFTPPAYGDRAAVLAVPVGSPLAPRTVALAGIGGRTPSALSSVVVDSGFGMVQLRWTAPADLGSPASVAYRVYRAFTGTAMSPDPVATTTATGWVDRAARGGQSYYYQVVPFNPAGDGPLSELDQVRPAYTAVLETSEVGGRQGLYEVTESGARIPFLVGGPFRFDPELSPDGTKVVFAQGATADPASASDLYVARLDGSTAPVKLVGLTGDELEPSWSPDGATIAFTRMTDTAIEVRTVPAAGGATSLRAANMSHASWLPDSSRVVAENDDNGYLYVVPSPAAGRATAIAGSSNGYAPAVSPDGRRVAYVHDDGTGAPALSVLPVGGGTRQSLTDSLEWDSPAWSGDGTRLYGERYAADQPRLALVGWTPAGFSQPGWVTDATTYDATPAFGDEGIRVTSAARITGASAAIGFAAPQATDVTCALDGAAAYSCATPVRLASLTAGLHTLVLTGHGPVGAQVPDSVTAVQWTVDRTAPAMSVSSPTASGATTVSTATFSYRGSDPAGMASYDVRYRKAGSNGGYGLYTSPAGWTGSTTTTKLLAVSPGYEYCFSVRGRDKVGNVSGWTADRCLDVAMDDRSLTAGRGWTRATASGAYKSTVTVSKTAGAALTLRAVQTRRVTLLVTRCSTCGTLGVYLGSTRIGVVDTRAATTQRAVRVALPLLPGVRSGSLTIKPLVTGRTVQVDGIAFGRS